MKPIKIAHLYYDLMNLYGETANIKAIKKFLERQNVECEIYFLTIGDKIDFNAYDFYYIGAGSEENQLLVLDDLKKYKDKIIKAIDNNKMFLITGNAMELFGKKIKKIDSKDVDCLGIFPFQATMQEKRQISEIYYKYDQLKENEGQYILGFRNCDCIIVHNDEKLFDVNSALCKNNFYAMNFVGPFLIRNPYFTNKLVEELITSKGYKFTPITDTIEFKAYHEFLRRYLEELETQK